LATDCCHGNENREFKRKIRNRSDSITDSAKELAPNRGFLKSCTMKCPKNLAQTDPCCNGNDYKYKPILNDSAPVNISETDKANAIDFKCGAQLQT